jgi:hypothetical protein
MKNGKYWEEFVQPSIHQFSHKYLKNGRRINYIYRT